MVFCHGRQEISELKKKKPARWEIRLRKKDLKGFGENNINLDSRTFRHYVPDETGMPA